MQILTLPLCPAVAVVSRRRSLRATRGCTPARARLRPPAAEAGDVTPARAPRAFAALAAALLLAAPSPSRALQLGSPDAALVRGLLAVQPIHLRVASPAFSHAAAPDSAGAGGVPRAGRGRRAERRRGLRCGLRG